MAIFHLTTKTFSRGKGQSAIAAAAYRSGEKLFDEQANEEKSYEARRERIIFTSLFVPGDAPDWAHDRNRLWNEVERKEKRHDARLAREIEVGLPHELTPQQRQWLVIDYVRENFLRKGYVADVAIHAPHGEGDLRNHHAHILIAERTIGVDGFAANKDRAMNSEAQLTAWREDWERRVNRSLERFGHEARVDHRSLAAQGIDREPGIHLGYAAAEMVRRGASTDRGDDWMGIAVRNADRDDHRDEMAYLEAEIRSLENEQAREAREERQREIARQEAAARAQDPEQQLEAKLTRAAETETRVAGDRDAAMKALEQLERQDRRAPPAGRDFAEGAREQAREIRAEVRSDAREEKFWGDQEAWQGRVAATPPRQGTERTPSVGLRVVDGATGAVSKLGDFILDFLGGSSAPQPERSASDDVRAFLRSPGGRREQLAAQDRAQRQQADAENALQEIAKDMQAGRKLKAEDIKRLTPDHLIQIRHFGDDRAREMAREAEERAKACWKDRGRERNWWD